MRVVRTDCDFAAACRGGRGSAWQRFRVGCWNRHHAYYEALVAQQVCHVWPGEALPGLFERGWRPACLKLAQGIGDRIATAALAAHARCVAALGHGEETQGDLDFDVYLGFGFHVAPASSLIVGGRPAIALHVEHPRCRAESTPTLVAHEFAHCARAATLALPLSPAELPLGEMLAYEGTAALFADAVLGADTLGQMMPPGEREWHEAHADAVIAAARAEWDRRGRATAMRWFGVGARPSGYWVGERLCRGRLDARAGRMAGPGNLRALLSLPARELFPAAEG